MIKKRVRGSTLHIRKLKPQLTSVLPLAHRFCFLSTPQSQNLSLPFPTSTRMLPSVINLQQLDTPRNCPLPGSEASLSFHQRPSSSWQWQQSNPHKKRAFAPVRWPEQIFEQPGGVVVGQCNKVIEISWYLVYWNPEGHLRIRNALYLTPEKGGHQRTSGSDTNAEFSAKESG